MIKELLDEINEVNKNPVEFIINYKDDSDIFGHFYVNEIEYNFNIKIEKFDEYKYGWLKFYREDLKDPYSLSNDFNSHLVVKNTIINIVKFIIENYNIDMFVVKRNKNEKSMIKKYIAFLSKLGLNYNFTVPFDYSYKEYHYIFIMKSKCLKLFKQYKPEDIIKIIEN